VKRGKRSKKRGNKPKDKHAKGKDKSQSTLRGVANRKSFKSAEKKKMLKEREVWWVAEVGGG